MHDRALERERERETEREKGREEDRRAKCIIDKTLIIARFVHMHAN